MSNIGEILCRRYSSRLYQAAGSLEGAKVAITQAAGGGGERLLVHARNELARLDRELGKILAEAKSEERGGP